MSSIADHLPLTMVFDGIDNWLFAPCPMVSACNHQRQMSTASYGCSLIAVLPTDNRMHQQHGLSNGYAVSHVRNYLAAMATANSRMPGISQSRDQ